jgi:hypothetical protein
LIHSISKTKVSLFSKSWKISIALSKTIYS